MLESQNSALAQPNTNPPKFRPTYLPTYLHYGSTKELRWPGPAIPSPRAGPSRTRTSEARHHTRRTDYALRGTFSTGIGPSVFRKLHKLSTLSKFRKNVRNVMKRKISSHFESLKFDVH